MKRRKQTIKFRPKYAGRVAKEWSQRAIRALVGAGLIATTVGGAMGVRHVWSRSDAFKIREIILQGDIPAGLQNKLSFDRTTNMWMIRPANAQRDILVMFPELRAVSIRRSWSRNVVVTGHYRTPIAWFSDKGKTRFIDKGNVAFDLPADTVDPARLPQLQWSAESDRLPMLHALAQWAERHPSFSSQIAKCETDTIHRLQVELADGTVVDWGEFNPASLDLRTERVMRVKENYHAASTPARLLFVTDDRLVMDAHWTATKAM